MCTSASSQNTILPRKTCGVQTVEGSVEVKTVEGSVEVQAVEGILGSADSGRKCKGSGGGKKC